jgi:hypothetical protein
VVGRGGAATTQTNRNEHSAAHADPNTHADRDAYPAANKHTDCSTGTDQHVHAAAYLYGYGDCHENTGRCF